MLLPRLFLTSLAFTTFVSSEIANEAGHVDPAHEAPPAQDKEHGKPVRTDAESIEEEDATSTSAIEIAFHGSDATPKKKVAEMIVQPSGEVFEGKFDQAYEAPRAQHAGHANSVHAGAKAIDDEDAESTTAIEIAFHGSEVAQQVSDEPQIRTATKVRRVTGERDVTKQVVRADTTPTALGDHAAEVKDDKDIDLPVLRTDVTPNASPVAATRVQWSYDTRQNKWVEVKEFQSSSAPDPTLSSVATTLNFYLQRNLSRWKRIIAQVEVGKLIYISIVVLSMIVAVWCSAWSFSVSRAMSKEVKEEQLPSRQEFGMDDDDDDDGDDEKAPSQNDGVSHESDTRIPPSQKKPLTDDGLINKAHRVRDLRAMYLKKIEADATNKFPTSQGETCSNVQVKD